MLKVHFDFGVHQMLRAARCIDHLHVGLKRKQEIVERVFTVYIDALGSASAWASHGTLVLFDDVPEYDEIAKELGSSVGVALNEDHEAEMRQRIAQKAKDQAKRASTFGEREDEDSKPAAEPRPGSEA